MFCPSCGEKASADQKFCRACGFSLEKVAPLLSDGPSEQKPNEIIEQHGKRLRRISLYVIGGGLAMALALGFPAIIYNLFMEGNLTWALLLSIIFISLSSASLISIIRMMLKQVAGEIKMQRSRPPAIEAPDTDRMLGAVPVSSVAEKTTDRLKTPC